VKVSELFKKLSKNQSKLKIIDWAVSNTSKALFFLISPRLALEEVFLKVTLSDAQSANSKDRWVSDNIPKQHDDDEVELDQKTL